MNTDTFLQELDSIEQNLGAFQPHNDGTHRVTIQDVEIVVAKDRLNDGYSWSVFERGNLVVGNKHQDTRSAAAKQAIAFTRGWATDQVSA